MEVDRIIHAKASATFSIADGIALQPEEISAALRGGPNARVAGQWLVDAEHVIVIGTGTSFHAAQVTEHLYRTIGLAKTFAITSYDYSQDRFPFGDEKDVAIIFSHRGSKKYSKQCIDMLRSRGCKIIIITGKNSPLIAEFNSVDKCMVFVTSEQETSAMHTKSYTSAVSCACLIGIQFSTLTKDIRGEEEEDLDLVLTTHAMSISQSIAKSLAPECSLRQKALEVARAHLSKPVGSMMYVVGGSLSGVIAREAALKIKEACYIPVEGEDLEQFIHGPIVGIEPSRDTIILLYNKYGSHAGRSIELESVLKKLGADVVTLPEELIANFMVQSPSSLASAAVTEGQRVRIGEYVSSFASVLFMQLVAVYLAVLKDINPDCFRRNNETFKNAMASIQL